MKWLPALVGLIAVSSCADRTTLDDADQSNAPFALQALLDEGVTQGMPGLSAAVATRDSVVWTGVAGLADIRGGVPVSSDMLFGIGSITKIFVAVVILQLAEEGRLDLDATSASVLGPAVSGVPNADKATIAQLLNHTGGVPSWEDDPSWIRDGRGTTLDVSRIWGKTETLPYIEGHEPLAEPGAEYSYANTPLGLEDIHLEGFEPVPEQQLPHRYHWATPTFLEEAGVNATFSDVRPDLIDASGSNLSVEWPAGGMVSTARDLALYGAALRDGRLLNPESMAFLTDWFPTGERRQMGHNVTRFEYASDGLALIGHNGSVLGFTGSLYGVEGADIVVAVVANVGTMHSGGVPGSAFSVARAREFVDGAMAVAGGGR